LINNRKVEFTKTKIIMEYIIEWARLIKVIIKSLVEVTYL